MKQWSKKKKVVIAAGVALLGLAGIYGYQVFGISESFSLPGTGSTSWTVENDSKKKLKMHTEKKQRSSTDTDIPGDESENHSGKDLIIPIRMMGKLKVF